MLFVGLCHPLANGSAVAGFVGSCHPLAKGSAVAGFVGPCHLQAKGSAVAGFVGACHPLVKGSAQGWMRGGGGGGGLVANTENQFENKTKFLGLNLFLHEMPTAVATKSHKTVIFQPPHFVDANCDT